MRGARLHAGSIDSVILLRALDQASAGAKREAQSAALWRTTKPNRAHLACRPRSSETGYFPLEGLGSVQCDLNNKLHGAQCTTFALGASVFPDRAR